MKTLTKKKSKQGIILVFSLSLHKLFSKSHLFLLFSNIFVYNAFTIHLKKDKYELLHKNNERLVETRQTKQKVLFSCLFPCCSHTNHTADCRTNLHRKSDSFNHKSKVYKSNNLSLCWLFHSACKKNLLAF